MAKTFPKAEDAFYKKQELITSKTGPRLAELGVDTDWYQNRLLAAKVTYVTAYQTCLDPKKCTKSTRKERDEARVAYQALLSQLVEWLKALPKVKHSDLDDMEIAYAKGGGGQPGPPPEDAPVMEEDTATIRRVKFKFRPAGSETRGKPIHVQGMELVGGFFETEPVVEEMQRSWFSTRSPLVIEFRSEERGKIFYYCVRWESKSGKKGPWSKVMSVMVP